MMLAMFQALRPRQWSKNLLIFAGILFSRQIGDLALVARAIEGFFAFSLVASASYIWNDLRDIEADRLHPKKRRRAIASGRLPIGVARIEAPLVALAGALLAIRLGKGFLIVLAVYFLQNLVYTSFLKRQVLLDVFAISIGFVLRAIAGVELLLPVAPGTELSPWLLVCTFFGALFLALSKRRRELGDAGGQASRQREVLESYTPALLDGLLMVSAAASVMGYALYTIWPATVAKFGTEALLYTVPFVAYGIFRYLYLVGVSDRTEDPSHVLISDRPLAICVLGYLAAVLIILYGRG
ncbi:MAG: decaprenyl-phosphate phosphoribosyltransferase [Candidatus Eisenbacteria bacterium]|uniref:Decaprenyl-phosphate phosphoribosyltransferase n=1 Tax=Eiseniibacteriota bacterium TaxID=2212470 RepID=A0A538U8M8_UNCEI|nr:MAG: decaprenyl-phosphate phosphoribosyltransferase [Candidatus Eisenbacteria bacterium]